MGGRSIEQAVIKERKIPNLLMLTKGLSIYKNNYELLVDKLERLLNEKVFQKLIFQLLEAHV